MPVPQHDEFVVDAAFLATGDEGVPKFVSMVMREKPFDHCIDSIEICFFRLFKVDIRQDFAQHGSNGDFTGNDVPAHFFFAGVAFQPILVDDAECLQFASAHTGIKQNKQSVRSGEFRVVDAVIDELFFFRIGKSTAFLALMFGQYDFRHGGIEFIVIGGKIEDAAQDKL